MRAMARDDTSLLRKFCGGPLGTAYIQVDLAIMKVGSQKTKLMKRIFGQHSYSHQDALWVMESDSICVDTCL